jgi:hypothetical protein
MVVWQVCRSSASHERDDFDAIAIGKTDFGVTLPRDKLEVDFDGHAPRVEPQAGKKIGHRRPGRHSARLSIVDDLSGLAHQGATELEPRSPATGKKPGFLRLSHFMVVTWR